MTSTALSPILYFIPTSTTRHAYVAKKKISPTLTSASCTISAEQHAQYHCNPTTSRSTESKKKREEKQKKKEENSITNSITQRLGNHEIYISV